MMQSYFVRKTSVVFLTGLVLSILAGSLSAQNMFRKMNDFDGDGKTDLAIWRPGAPQSHYWINGSSGGVGVFTWGLSTDNPVSY